MLKSYVGHNHPAGWHFEPTEMEKRNYSGSSKPDPCVWFIGDDGGGHCSCGAFGPPEVVRRREAIEHTRRKLGL